jgi:uncharacterized protein (UPF0335 family)
MSQLRTIIERVERLETEIAELNSDKSDIFKEAKANGFDVKAIRKIVAMRRQDADKRREEETILQLYANALGLQLGFEF